MCWPLIEKYTRFIMECSTPMYQQESFERCAESLKRFDYALCENYQSNPTQIRDLTSGDKVCEQCRIKKCDPKKPGYDWGLVQDDAVSQGGTVNREKAKKPGIDPVYYPGVKGIFPGYMVPDNHWPGNGDRSTYHAVYGRQGSMTTHSGGQDFT